MEKSDIFGLACLDYLSGDKDQEIFVHSDEFFTDPIQVSYLFRTIKEMPGIEKVALDQCKGKILDIGAGAGSHSLELQNIGKNVHSLEISSGLVKVMKERSIKKVLEGDFFQFQKQKYDTLLLLMNNIGIAGSLIKLPNFLLKSISLLEKGGQILLTSADISYAFIDDYGNMNTPWHKEYYGEIEYQLHYKELKGNPFEWLFVDFFRLSLVCKELNLRIEKIMEGENFDYLARITIQ